MSNDTPAPAPMTAEVDEFCAWLRLEQNEPGISAGLAWRYQRTQELLTALTARVATLEDDLAAARKVEDDEVAKYVLRVRTIANHALDPSPARDDLHYAADLLTRLTAALKEAGRRAERAERMHAEAFRIGIAHQERALAAEAQLKEAREKALEEAATMMDRFKRQARHWRTEQCFTDAGVAIRALKDTSHD